MKNKKEYVINGLKIDPLIFTTNFSCKCGGECCHYGVYTDFEEHKKILSLKDELIPLMDETQTTDISKWFEEPEVDTDFPSGKAVGTELFSKKCVFLDRDGLCVIQKNSMQRGRPKWQDKPIYCILYPLTIFEGALTVDDEHMERLKTCNRTNSKFSIIDSCAEELIHFLGEDGYKKLIEYRIDYFESVN